jgi:hypothetical protein
LNGRGIARTIERVHPVHRFSARVLLACFSALLIARCGAGGGTAQGGGGSGSSGGEQNVRTNESLGGSGDGGALESADDAATTMAIDAGIAPAADSGSSVTTNVAEQDFPIAPLHLTPTSSARNADAQLDVELRADGTIYSHGQLVGQVSGRRVLSPTGREILAIQTDGTVTVGGTATRVRLRDDGDMQMPTGAILTFTDDGTPVAIGPNQQREEAPMRVIGFRGELRRTAALLAVLAATVAMPH